MRAKIISTLLLSITLLGSTAFASEELREPASRDGVVREAIEDLPADPKSAPRQERRNPKPVIGASLGFPVPSFFNEKSGPVRPKRNEGGFRVER